jgi:Tol biopolymer transport system component
VAPPAWANPSELLVLSSETTSGLQHVELADVLVQARYPLPGVSGEATAAVVSPDGTQLAVHRDGAGVTGTWLVSLGSTAPPRGLDANLTPVGFTGAGTLVATARGASTVNGLVRVSVSGDEQIPIAQGAGIGSPASVAVSRSGRQLVFIAADASGQLQAYVENADGSDPQPLTVFQVNSFDAVTVSVSG